MDPRAFSGALPGAGAPQGLGAAPGAFPPGPASAPLRLAPIQSTLTFSRFSRAVNPSSKTK